ncbi:hypothetical protein quinque_008881 [Culex quinquefasciatus]
MIRTIQKGEVEDRWENPTIATVTLPGILKRTVDTRENHRSVREVCGSKEEDPVDAILEESRPTIGRSGRKQEEPALICGHPEPLGVRTLRVQADADASVRRKPPDTRGIPRAVHRTAVHDRSRTRIARDTVPVWEPPSRRRHFGLWTNRREIRRQPHQPLHQPMPETRQTGRFIYRGPRVHQHTRERRGRWRS